MAQFTTLTGRVAPLNVDNIDTDQVIPARFLKVTSKDGLADNLFADWRQDPSFVLNQPEVQGSQILLAGGNFGCGSSREHAPWALVAWGFRAVVATSFADIFNSNALKNGLIPIVVDATTHAALLAAREADAGVELSVDLAAQTLSLPGGGTVSFEVDGFAKRCLLDGVDQLGYLQRFTGEVEAYEAARG